MPVLPELATLLDTLNARPRPTFTDAADRRRQALEAVADGNPYAAFVEPGPEVADVHDEWIDVAAPAGSIRVRVYRPEVVEGGALVFLHGGGWWMGSVDETDIRCRSIAAGAGVVVVSVDYRLAPDFRFPTGLEDSFRALCWTVEQAARFGFDATRVGIGGESAGGNLAAAASLLARERGGPELSLQVLEIPCLDLTLSSPSAARYGDGYVLPRAELEWIVETYLGGHDPADPLVSPLFAEDVTGLPPAFIASAECDPLADDARRYAARLSTAGVDVRYREYEGHVHGSQTLTALLQSAREWRSALIAATRSHLTDPRRSPSPGASSHSPSG